MKSKIVLIVSVIILGLSLDACKNREDKPTKTEITNVEEKKDSIKPKVEVKKTEPINFKSKLRPNENIELNKVYTDTISFIVFNDDADYWFLTAKKNKDTVTVLYKDDAIRDLINGDKITIDWKLKQLQEAGDDEIVYTKPYLLSFKKDDSVLKNEKVKILWRENQYNEEFQTNIDTIVLSEGFFKNISQQERAALGYVATFIGSECEWDGEANQDRSNLKCQLLSALNLGYQCSNTHLKFLRNWFSQDTAALERLKSCPTVPNTATMQSTFEEIFIQTNTKEQTISINYKVAFLNTRKNTLQRYSKKNRFKYSQEGVVLIDSKEKRIKHFVVSCGSGCAMRYTEDAIVEQNNSKELSFKVEMFVNEVLQDMYNETYIYNCETTFEADQIKLKGVKDDSIEDLHPELIKKLKLYTEQLCK